MDNTTDNEAEINFIESKVIRIIEERYRQSSDARDKTEEIWLDAFAAYRGVYSQEERARIDKMREVNPAASDVYIKITKTKVQAAYAQILEVLFADNKFPIGVKSTPIPNGIAETVRLVDKPIEDMIEEDVIGYEGDGRELTPGATRQSLLNGLVDKYKSLIGSKTVEEGPALDPSHIQINPADEAAKELEKQIHDQLTEANAEFALRKTAFECALLGTGVLKGPFSYNKTNHKFSNIDGKISYDPNQEVVPRYSHVSAWNIFPDPEAARIEDADYLIERHLMNRSAVRDLLNMPLFNKDAIKDVLQQEPHYEKEDWEDHLQDNATEVTTDRYEVFEYWGYFDSEVARAMGLDISDDEILDVVQVNAWICNGRVLRFVLNPFTPNIIPYYIVPYEEQPYQLWGVGVPENMQDTQELINSHMRMGVDNLRFAGNMVFEVNENQLAPGQNMQIYPGKAFRKQGGAPGQSIYGITFPNTAGSHMQMFDKAMQVADQQTGIPSVTHGQTGVSGVGRTASGISMLMSAAALNIKTVIRNFDHYLLRPLGQNTFYWNMQFNDQNVKIRGDVEIVARGTTSLMQKEVKTQRLISFLQISGGDPIVNRQHILKDIASSLDLDPDKIINDPQMALLYQQLMQGQQNANVQQGAGQTADTTNASGSPASPGAVNTGTTGPDTTGGAGGNIGTGTAPNPGEDGFTG